MKIINEQYKSKCFYEDFRVSLFDASIESIEYCEDGSVVVRIVSDSFWLDSPYDMSSCSFIKLTALKSV